MVEWSDAHEESHRRHPVRRVPAFRDSGSRRAIVAGEIRVADADALRARATELLIAQLQRNETGIPDWPSTTTICCRSAICRLRLNPG